MQLGMTWTELISDPPASAPKRLQSCQDFLYFFHFHVCTLVLHVCGHICVHIHMETQGCRWALSSVV